jgi:hypothetical protein
MSSLVSSVGNMVEAGVKGLIGLAETYYNSEDEDGVPTHENGEGNGDGDVDREGKKVEPVSIRLPEHQHPHERSTTSNTSYSTSSSTTSSISIVSKPITQGALVQILDVPSGWIHLQSTYLDGAGTRKVRSFGLKNLSDQGIDVVVQSDLGNQILFWMADDECTFKCGCGADDSDELFCL